MIGLIVLLGNTGTQYRRTRHNVAWQFGEYCGWDGPWKAKWGAQFYELHTGTKSVLVIKPQKMMNRSGESVAHFAGFKRLGSESILVVHDDVELDFGEVILKRGGGLGGHNGLRSIEQRLGSREFLRLRIGVGRPNHGTVASYVLGAFSKAEEQALDEIFFRAERILADAIRN